MRPLDLTILLGCAIVAGCGNGRRGLAPSGTLLNTVSFETRTEHPAGVDRLSSGFVGDLTRDGVPDLATVDFDGTLQILVGLTPTGFAAGRRYALSGRPIAIDAADLNQDGSLDLVVVCEDVDRADVFVNDGFGDFAPAVGTPIAPGALSMALGDVDGDGDVDLLVTPSRYPGVECHLGDGAGRFAPARVLRAERGDRAIGLAIADIDGDSRNDVLFCDSDRNRLVVLRGRAGELPGDPRSFEVGIVPVAVVVGDLTADGIPDVAVANLASETIDVLVRGGSRGLERHATLAADGQPGNLAIGDVTGDGVADLLASIIDRRAISIFVSAGGILAESAVQTCTTGSPLRPFVTDLDADGVSDLAVFALGADVVNVYIGRERGLAGSRLHPVAGVHAPEFVAAGDFDGDGATEVAVGGTRDTVVTVLDARADGVEIALTHVLSIDLGARIQNLVAADIDQDGRLDLLVAVDGGVRILANTSDASALSFEVLPSDGLLAPAAGPFEMLGEDIDGDDVVDLVVAYHASNRVSVLLGKRGGAFEFDDPISVAIAGRPLGLAAADFDGDGRKEIAVSRVDVATVTIVDLNDAGVLVAGLDIPVGAVPNYLRTADFNLDGLADLVVSNAEADSVTMLLAQRRGGSFLNIDIEAGNRPTALLTRDLNRDGFPDILVASLNGSDFRIVLGDGRGGVLRALEFPGTHTAVSAALADLNGNGLDDLMIGSLVTRRLAVFKNISRRD